MQKKLEVIAFNISCCRNIEAGGAHRIELCANPADGGTTPSYGFIQAACAAVAIDIFPIIRPRGGDFYYSSDEFEVMKQDVMCCRELGCKGIVTGILHPDGSVDTKRMKELIAIAGDMEVTFHRAFDRTSDPFKALEQIIELGCSRILTSGLKPTAAEGISLIEALIKKSDERIIIMPGSGIRSENIGDIAQKTGATELHSSARRKITGKMEYINPEMPDDAGFIEADKEEISRMTSILKSL